MTRNFTLNELISILELAREEQGPDAIPTMIGRDGRESLIACAEANSGRPSYVVLRPGSEVI